MHERIKGEGKSRLKRTNFVALAKGEISKHEVLASPDAVSLHMFRLHPGKELSSRN